MKKSGPGLAAYDVSKAFSKQVKIPCCLQKKSNKRNPAENQETRWDEIRTGFWQDNSSGEGPRMICTRYSNFYICQPIPYYSVDCLWQL